MSRGFSRLLNVWIKLPQFSHYTKHERAGVSADTKHEFHLPFIAKGFQPFPHCVFLPHSAEEPVSVSPNLVSDTARQFLRAAESCKKIGSEEIWSREVEN